jgi:hypothetical protein
MCLQLSARVRRGCHSCRKRVEKPTHICQPVGHNPQPTTLADGSTSRQFRWRGWSKTPVNASSGRSEPNTSNAVFTCGWTRALASVDRSAAALSTLRRSISASARIRPASHFGACTSMRTRPRAAARRRWARVALRCDVLPIAPAPFCSSLVQSGYITETTELQMASPGSISASSWDSARSRLALGAVVGGAQLCHCPGPQAGA